MQNKLEQAINILEKNNQLQVAKLIKVLNKEKQEKLVNQVLSIDFEQLNNLYHKATQKPEILEKKIEYIKYVDKNKLSEEELNLYKSEGEKIIKNNGLIISEYSPEAKPDKYTFPERNRIISGLSSGVLVVEAKENSGSLITVDFALEQGKEVYVIPGDINRKNTKGTNELIKQGAKLVTGINDILEDFVNI